mmetsp:Transcript_19249/g.50027  ORF Transcript_19249/g.50027 Transcript_19249/m.50027 type:complete len:113 (-) Transcript_19249:959-1297(-)
MYELIISHQIKLLKTSVKQDNIPCSQTPSSIVSSLVTVARKGLRGVKAWKKMDSKSSLDHLPSASNLKQPSRPTSLSLNGKADNQVAKKQALEKASAGATSSGKELKLMPCK